MSIQLQNYIAGTWVKGTGKQAELLDAITGDLIGTTPSGSAGMKNGKCRMTNDQRRSSIQHSSFSILHSTFSQ
ncbi:MAG: hypothetical protein KA791_13660 [Flavobacteriales bacterium]|nr:hypothetical protein [Flavobacteriales bacterium]